VNDKAPTCDNLEDTGVEYACGSVSGFATSGQNHTGSGLGKPIHYLDLERPSDIAKLADPELYLGKFADHLVILDEIQRLPDLFPVLRSLVDERRRAGEAFG
jgi:predicted AAA+ superfamily ATPase